MKHENLVFVKVTLKGTTEGNIDIEDGHQLLLDDATLLTTKSLNKNTISAVWNNEYSDR